MRRSPVVTLILAIIAFSLAAAPANAAAPRTAATPRSLIGAVCETVHSNARHKTGVICIGLAVQDGKMTRNVGAMATFTPGSGQPVAVSAQRLVLYVRGKLAVSGVYHSRRNSGTVYLSTRNRNLWDGHPGRPAVRVRAALLDACFYWPGGGKACTGTRWLYSHSEFVLP